MKLSYLIALVFSTIILSSCMNSADTGINYGTYYGNLPCADCPGVLVNLILNEDSSYKEELKYLGDKPYTIVNRGTFTVKGSLIDLHELQVEDTASHKYKIQGETLVMVNSRGELAGEELAEHYILTTEKPENFGKAENKTIPD